MDWLIVNSLLFGRKGRGCRVVSRLIVTMFWTQLNKNMYLFQPFFYGWFLWIYLPRKTSDIIPGSSILDNRQVSNEHLEQWHHHMTHNAWLSSTDFKNKINALPYDYDCIWIDGVLKKWTGYQLSREKKLSFVASVI